MGDGCVCYPWFSELDEILPAQLGLLTSADGNSKEAICQAENRLYIFYQLFSMH